MSVHPPRRRQLVPPTPEEAQRLAAVRAGPPLRDPEAAADCHCGCHPKAADAELHDGGRSCGCQLTPEKRHLALKEFTEQLNDLDPDPGRLVRRGGARSARRELGVSATWWLVAAPFVITGNVDGRGFYLRERHGSYRVTIAPDDDPGADPWELPAERLTLDIAGGDDDDPHRPARRPRRGARPDRGSARGPYLPGPPAVHTPTIDGYEKSVLPVLRGAARRGRPVDSSTVACCGARTTADTRR